MGARLAREEESGLPREAAGGATDETLSSTLIPFL